MLSRASELHEESTKRSSDDGTAPYELVDSEEMRWSRMTVIVGSVAQMMGEDGSHKKTHLCELV